MSREGCLFWNKGRIVSATYLPLVAGLLAAMMSIDPELTPAQLRILLRRGAMTIGEEYDFEPTDADDLCVSKAL